jgi:hypothetical protein
MGKVAPRPPAYSVGDGAGQPPGRLPDNVCLQEVSGDEERWPPISTNHLRTIRERSEVVGVLGLIAARVAALLQVSLKGR